MAVLRGAGGYRRLVLRLLAAVCALAVAAGAGAGPETGPRLVPEASRIVDSGDGLRLLLALGAPVEWRVFTLDAPRRLVVDLAGVDLDGPETVALDRSGRVTALRSGLFRPRWSRLVLMLDAPYRLAEAAMRGRGEGAVLEIVLAATTAGEFAAASGAPEGALWPAPPAPDPAPPARDDGRIVVVLDPGHGGIDPGAERDGESEGALMLAFARELRAELLASGRYEVQLTRDADLFVPLAARVGRARAAGAQVLLSLHADALPEGRAQGAAVYTLSETASDPMADDLARSHDDADLLAGVDLAGAGDQVARVLADLAQRETAPRAGRLAEHLVAAMGGAGLALHAQPVRRAGFSVLRAADFPSVLVELGFLSEAEDLARLRSPEWRAGMAAAIRAGLDAWAVEDAAMAPKRRR